MAKEATSVIIKSYKNGLAVHLDPQADMETIKKDIAKTFKQSASFFKDAKMAISFEDRELDSNTERELVNIITNNSDLQITCIAGKNQITQQLLTNALNQIEYKSELQKNVVQVYNGSLKDSMVMDVPGSILILGDVYPGSSIIANGDIYIYGGLYGQAFAGNNGDEKRIVCALDLNPEKLRIAGIKYKPAEKPKWSIINKQSVTPKVAYYKDYTVITEPVTRQFWNDLFDEDGIQLP